METFWVLGQHFADDHDRAIRFIDPPNQSKLTKMHVPVDSKIQVVWCDKCSAWHLTRTSNVTVRNGLKLV